MKVQKEHIIFILGIVATYFLYGYIQEIKVKEQEQIKIKSQYREKNYNDVYNMTKIINNLVK